MKSLDYSTRKTRWTLYIGKAGKDDHRHQLRFDRLNLQTNQLRTLILVR